MGSLDGAPEVAMSSPAKFNFLGLGAHTFSVRAVDGAGNADPTPAARQWTVSPGGARPTLLSGDAVPGAGSGVRAPVRAARGDDLGNLMLNAAGGAPADAMLTNFGTPAVDGPGNLAFPA